MYVMFPMQSITTPALMEAPGAPQLVDGESLRAYAHRQPCHKLPEQALPRNRHESNQELSSDLTVHSHGRCFFDVYTVGGISMYFICIHVKFRERCGRGYIFNKCAATTPEDLERFWDGKTTETNNLWRPCVFARRELRSKCRGP